MTWLPTGADELVGELVLDLLLEQPAIPATTVAAAAMPTKIPDFATGLLRLVALENFGGSLISACVRKIRCRLILDALMASPPTATLRPGRLLMQWLLVSRSSLRRRISRHPAHLRDSFSEF